MGNDGIRLVGANGGAGAVAGVSIRDCLLLHNYGNGLTLTNAIVPHILRTHCSLNRQYGAKLKSSDAPQIVSSAFAANQVDGGSTAPQLFIETTTAFRVEGNHFESFDATSSKTAISVVGTRGGVITTNLFVGAGTAGGRGILIAPGSPPDEQSTSISIGPNLFFDVDILAELGDSPFVSSCVIQPQPVASAAGVAAKLIVPERADRGHLVFPATRIGSPSDWRFNLTAGIEFPRLSASKRDSLIAAASGGPRREGLVIYNDNAKRLQHWDGSRWMEGIVSVSGSERNLLNQTGTIATTDLLTNPPAGLYRVTISAVRTSSGMSRTINLMWTDEGGNHTEPTSIGTSPVSKVFALSISSGSLQFNVTGGAGNYSLRIAVEALP